MMNECCPVSCYQCKPDLSAEFSWLGCYKDDADRNLNEGPKEFGYNPASCAEGCAEYEYFALQANGYCHCGNSYGEPADKYPRLDPVQC